MKRTGRAKRSVSGWSRFFGWMKTVGGFRRSRYVGLERTGLCGELVATAYNLVRRSRLIPELETEVPVSG